MTTYMNKDQYEALMRTMKVPQEDRCADCKTVMEAKIVLFRSVVDDRGTEMGGYCTERKEVCKECAKKYEQ